MNRITVRHYNPKTDYEGVKSLYEDSSTYGGQFDIARDSAEKLLHLVEKDPRKIIVALIEDSIVGTVTLFEDERAARLYRFAVQKDLDEYICNELYIYSCRYLKEMGHTQVLVYAPAGNTSFEERYTTLGMNKGADYTAYWQDL